MQIRRRALSVPVILSCLASAVGAGSAHAAATSERVTVEGGQMVRVNQQGCVPATVTIPTQGSPSALAPAPGLELEGEDGGVAWTVVTAQPGPGNATWTLTPGPSCAETSPTTTWDFTYRSKVRKYVVRTTSGSRVRSIGGFRVNDATVKAARRTFGRPSRVRRVDRLVCTITWRKIGLQITFVNYASVGACQHGFAQVATITRPQLWAIQIDNRPAITSDSTPADLVERELAERVKGGWQLDSYFNMIGTEGYFPLVTAKARSARGPITGFELWLGRGGD